MHFKLRYFYTHSDRNFSIPNSYGISFDEDFGHVWKNKLVWKDNAEDYFKENIPLIEDYIVSKYNWLKDKMSELEHFKEEIERYNSLKEVI